MATRIPDPVLMTRLRLSAAGVEWAAGLLDAHAHRSFEGGWTPHQQLFHLLSTETQVFGPRLHAIVVEDQPAFGSFDEHLYLAEHYTEDGSLADLAQAFVEQRTATVTFLETLNPAQWARTARWPDGRTVDTAWIAGRALWHGLDHFATLLASHTAFDSLHAPAWGSVEG